MGFLSVWNEEDGGGVEHFEKVQLAVMGSMVSRSSELFLAQYSISP